MLTKITLATLLALSVTTTVAEARKGDHNLRERQTQTACERPAAPLICKD
jgi:hypothetical protein